ncbi:amino acid permease [Halobacillus aidingensis]|uniref:L-asparagine transporter n=1 Tax=Halobacillus aidingensis TaxID=240303 RepID=A0A1H0HTB4_HALAD|nr:amino acid permease [Halobacillus aidingensis]SDO22320.1 L-asparagine transporter [Halobacillus aidingensis]
MADVHKKGKLAWWQLSFIGIGCIIGTGFFLGSSIAIEKAGPAVLLAYLLAGIGTYIVFRSLAAMTANHPEKGSFRTYAKQAFGPWAGFSNGWVYWSSEMLIMGSQLTALAIFAQFWFSAIPLWMLACVFAVLGLLVIWLGVQQVERMENVFGLIKISAILMFILIAILAMTGVIGGGKPQAVTTPMSTLFDGEWSGLWIALLYAFYAFGGIEVMGLMANELKDPKDAPKSGTLMLIVLTCVYVVAFYFVITLASWKNISTEESPFLTALTEYSFPWVPHLFNSVLIIAGFSTMVASLYAVTTMVMTLSEEGDAPKIFVEKEEGKVSKPAFLLTISVVILSIILAVLLPDRIFEYVTTAAGLMLLYNWAFILLSYRKLMVKGKKGTALVFIGISLIVVAVTGTWIDSMTRIGFLVSLSFLVLIAVATWVKQNKTPQSGA